MNLLPGITELVAAFSDESQNQRLLRLAFPNNDGPQSTMLTRSLVTDEVVSRNLTFTVAVLSDDAHNFFKARTKEDDFAIRASEFQMRTIEEEVVLHARAKAFAELSKEPLE